MTTLAIDQGTTSTRALVLLANGESHITANIEHAQRYPKEGWVEHDPDELIRNIHYCIESSLGKYPDINSIGIDNQGESCLAWNKDTKEAISPVIVWQDQRTLSTIDALKSDGFEQKVLNIAGLPLDAYFSAAKLAWILKNNPKAAQLHKQGKLCLGTTDAFFLHRLTGKFISDMTTASRTSLMRLSSGEWSKELCELFDVPINTLPEIVPSAGELGTIKVGQKSIPVNASIVDQQASLVGHGCRNVGDTKITFGTGAFALTLTGDKAFRAPDQGLLPTVAWQLKHRKTFALDGGVYNAGSAINWGRSLGLFSDFSQINTFINTPAIERNLVFVPALSGLACPHWDRRAAGLWIGLSLNTTATDMMQAVLEGIAFRAGEVIAAIDALTSIPNRISIDGGISSNPYFCQFLSDVLSKEITVQRSTELTALGTALLASNHPSLLQSYSSNTKHLTVYKPTEIRADYTKRFSEAVIRSKNWNA